MTRAAVARTVGLVVLLVLAVTALLPATPASAHTELLGATPAAGSTVDEPVGRVTLRFEDAVLPDGLDVVVRGPGGDVDRGRPRASGAVVTVPVTLTRPGRHTVAFRVTGDDGHIVSGSYGFRVTTRGVGAVPVAARAGAEQQPTPAVAVAEASDGATSGRGSWLVVGSGLLMLAVVLGSAGWSGVRRRSGS